MSSSNKKILIIDDEKSLLKIMERFLQKLGHNAATAENGEEGLKIFTPEPAAFYGVIIDYNLPGMPTEEILVNLKQLNPKLKVFLSTGFSVNEILKEFTKVTIDATLQKPFTINDFKGMIDTL